MLQLLSIQEAIKVYIFNDMEYVCRWKLPAITVALRAVTQTPHHHHCSQANKNFPLSPDNIIDSIFLLG